MKISLQTAGRLLKRVEDEIKRELALWLPGPGAKSGTAPEGNDPRLPPRLVEYIEAKQQRLGRAYSDLESAQYGYCKSCAAAIAPERLDADPLASTCNSCARRHAL